MRHHRVAAMFTDQHQDFRCRLPLRRFLFGVGQLGEAERGIAERYQLPPNSRAT
jgi:hypothetical protein